MRRLALATLAVTAAAWPCAAQEILLDRYLEMAGVTLFASRVDPHAWYYLPDTPRVAASEAGLPEFSLVKYTTTAEAAGGSQGISAARGGGVFHLLATYGVTPERLSRAEEGLRSAPERKDDRILGPIGFRAGSFALVSSVVAAGGAMTRRLVGTGPAPLLEGGKVAVSSELTPEGATFLWKSFEMANPDVSLAFSMEIEGYRTPYEAELVANWDRLHERHDASVRAKVLWIGIDVKVFIDQCFSDGTIKLDVKGESAAMEPLLESAYAKVASLLFDPLPEPPRTESAGAGGVLDSLLGAVKKRSPVDLFAGYQFTRQRLVGTARIRLAQQRAERLNILLAGNIGPLARRWGKDERFFRAISLEDPAFRQREVAISFDGDAAEFARVVNTLVVQLEKQHADGTVTLREAMLDPRTLGEQGNRITFAYSNAGDADLQRWLRYRYRAVWSFRGGRQHDAGWQDADAFALSLRPPYAVRRVSFEGNGEVLAAAGVRSVLARLEWDFLGERRTENITLRPPGWSKEQELVLPSDHPTFRITLTWHLAGGRTLRSGPREEEGEIVYVDELPEASDTPAAPATGGRS